jgi:hypothetical protein
LAPSILKKKNMRMLSRRHSYSDKALQSDAAEPRC